MRLRLIYLFVCLAIIFSCSQDQANSNTANTVTKTSKLKFDKLSAEESGISFNNQIIENGTYNHILKDGIFNGGGVAVIDINNDGLQDLIFAGNMVDDKIYLNKGNMKFQDITANSGIKQGSWSTAIAVADVNSDGFLDFYVGKFIMEDKKKRKNHLYINNGNLTFTESAAEYGLADNGNCTAVNFFDYNKDGLLDLYVGNQPPVNNHSKRTNTNNIDKTKYSDKLFRNTGKGKFVDVTKESGVFNYNYTLSATVSDMNNDGWQDIYVASDYEEPDYFYQNNGDGTFTNVINTSMRHISNFTMGVDIADFNNDGLFDLYSTDMAPADNYRTKANMSGMNPEKFWGLALNGYHYQYMFNSLQLNNGNGAFSEIGQMAKVAQTDWSWATLFSDFDNDGDKDLYVTNGQPKDTRNKDYTNRRKEVMDSLVTIQRKTGKKVSINSLTLIELAPFEKLKNYLFINNGDLTFDDHANEVGLGDLSWSQGAVYADLDNDGDMDLVTSNIDDEAFIYRNKSRDTNSNNFIKFNLKGDHGQNILSYGAKVWIYTGDEMQIAEVSPTRGYLSSVDPKLNFGIGQYDKVDKARVQWLDGRELELKDVKANQMITLKQSDAKNLSVKKDNPIALFQDVTLNTGIDYVHIENYHDDYESEVLLPHRMSRLGPCSAKADVNGDGLEDLFCGGAAGSPGVLYIQAANSKFSKPSIQPWVSDKNSEDIDALFFDADGDNDQDLYIVSGGNEYPDGHQNLQDRLYINDGKGNYTKGKLPALKTSGGVANAADLDGDGDMDLFVGGRQVPNKYGYDGTSYILINNNGTYQDATQDISSDISSIGMVTDAEWIDIDNDNDQDLIIVGEWMPITVFENNAGKLTKSTKTANLKNTSGWWNRIVSSDMDGDGDLDLIAGNLGLNSKFQASPEKPFSIKVKDFDSNGTNDVYLAYYGQDGAQYPVRGRQCSSEQMPFVKEKFETYDAFAKASFNDVLGDLATGALSKEVQMFESVYIENVGSGEFKIHKLPNEAQMAPIFGILPKDWNNDGHMDLLVGGNYYEREVETTRSDAGMGTLLTGDGKGNFKAASALKTGIVAYMDVRSMTTIDNSNGKPLVMILNNNLGMQTYELAQ